ncbi:F0F1 ATP synthase subunit B [Phenylobacterium sp.]|uniref:F0F1 ATP synthase subunit B n=1 Tax=Phenylobacterium sp. TaxID=1871053 RepID=UPI00262491CB|nr:F0F1 ATP synthase subunit B [Phenylobacterium sp.]
MIKRALFLLAALALTALPALAAEGAEAQPSLLAGDIGNVFWTVLIFVLVLVVLGKFAWGPILSTLQTRESFIHEALAKAKHDRDEAEARLKQYEERLAGARGEATAIVEEGRRDAEVVKRKIEAAAKVEADKMIDRARREIQIATVTATRELYDLSARLATDMAARVIGRELSAKDHERLIAEAIDGISGSGPQAH